MLSIFTLLSNGSLEFLYLTKLKLHIEKHYCQAILNAKIAHLKLEIYIYILTLTVLYVSLFYNFVKNYTL